MTPHEINTRFEELKEAAKTPPKNQHERTLFSLVSQYCKILDGRGGPSCKTRLMRRAKYLKQWDYVIKLGAKKEVARQ